VLTNYDRARTFLTQHKAALLKIADELLAREVLDAAQVQRLVKGLELTEQVPTPGVPPSDPRRSEATDRPPIVPPIPKPITQA
jgi:cell division protease FtsH